jgi:hypothetical protein
MNVPGFASVFWATDCSNLPSWETLRQCRQLDSGARICSDPEGRTMVKTAHNRSRSTHRKTTSKAAAATTHAARRQTALKAAPPAKAAAKLLAETSQALHRETASQLKDLREFQVPESMQALARSGAAQTRKLYERSKNFANRCKRAGTNLSELPLKAR